MAEKSKLKKALAALSNERLAFSASDVPSLAKTVAGFATGKFKNMGDVRAAATKTAKLRRGLGRKMQKANKK